MGTFCEARLQWFYLAYRRVHGYVSITVCIFGSIANILNIVVLTRPEMHSPTNCILTGLAVADLLVMLICIPISFHAYIFKTPHIDTYTFTWAWIVFLLNNLAQVFHTVSIWLTVALAVWRCIAVAYPQKNRDWCGKKRTIVTIIAGYIICPVLCIPMYISYTIVPEVMNISEEGNIVRNNYTDESYRNATLYFVKLSKVGKENVTIWIYSVVFKLIPCLLLTLLSTRLISALVETKKRREALVAASSGRKSSRNVEKERQTDRTTRMLLAVLLLFLLTEFPQGILGLLSVLLGDEFFRTCYLYLGDVMDFLALLNSAINFMIYCTMSRQFRYTFSKLFRPSWLPLPQGDLDNGINNHNMTTTVVTQV